MTTSTTHGRRPTIVQSVDRALALLEALSASPDGLPLIQVSAQVGLNPSTCHHLLATLASRGYVFQDPSTKHYLLGNRVLQLQYGRTRQMDLLAQAMPELQALNQQTQEAVHLAVMEANELVTLTKLESLHAVRVDSGFLGKSNAAHATATGKAILAHMSETELDRVIAMKGLVAFTQKTITSIQALKDELSRVRQEGYSTDNEEFQPGVYCIGAPVMNHLGRVVASVSCSVPLMRITDRGLRRLIDQVRDTARRISERMGHTPT